MNSEQCQPAQRHTIMYDPIPETSWNWPLCLFHRCHFRFVPCFVGRRRTCVNHLLICHRRTLAGPLSGRDSQGKSTWGPLRLQHPLEQSRNQWAWRAWVWVLDTPMILQLTFHESNRARENDQWLILYIALPCFTIFHPLPMPFVNGLPNPQNLMRGQFTGNPYNPLYFMVKTCKNHGFL